MLRRRRLSLKTGNPGSALLVMTKDPSQSNPFEIETQTRLCRRRCRSVARGRAILQRIGVVAEPVALDGRPWEPGSAGLYRDLHSRLCPVCSRFAAHIG